MAAIVTCHNPNLHVSHVTTNLFTCHNPNLSLQVAKWPAMKKLSL